MQSRIDGAPSFSHIHVDLAPGETVVAEAGAMQSMSAELDMKATPNGGFFSAVLKRFFGGESFFVSHFTNNTQETLRVTIAQPVPGQIIEFDLAGGNELCMQRGAYIASTPDVSFKVVWAGFASWFVGEGLVKLKASGQGKLWYGAYGAIIEREIDGELKIDDGHLVAYDPNLTLNVALAGGLFASLFGGEGFVARVTGKGKVYLQTRSLKGLASWINPKFRF